MRRQTARTPGQGPQVNLGELLTCTKSINWELDEYPKMSKLSWPIDFLSSSSGLMHEYGRKRRQTATSIANTRTEDIVS